MTAHNHTTLVPGCFRCDLNRDEMVDDDLRRELLQAIIPTQNEAGQVRTIDAAGAVLASGLLDRIRAEAWDEGEQAGQRKNHAWNPYRSEA